MQLLHYHNVHHISPFVMISDFCFIENDAIHSLELIFIIFHLIFKFAPADGPCPYIHGSCDVVCSQGYATNALQCEVCRCSRWCPFLPFNCFFDCPYGYATDRVGCKMCHCKRASESSSILADHLPSALAYRRHIEMGIGLGHSWKIYFGHHLSFF